MRKLLSLSEAPCREKGKKKGVELSPSSTGRKGKRWREVDKKKKGKRRTLLGWWCSQSFVKTRRHAEKCDLTNRRGERKWPWPPGTGRIVNTDTKFPLRRVRKLGSLKRRMKK